MTETATRYEVMLYGGHGGHISTQVITAHHARSAVKQAVRRAAPPIGALKTLAFNGTFERWEKWLVHGSRAMISAQARVIGPSDD